MATRCMPRLMIGIGLLIIATLAAQPRQRAALADGAAKLTLTPGSSQRPLTLRDRLVAGLRARRGSEVEFIDAVVAKVRLGKLPERLVNQTFFWARGRANRTGFRTVGTQRPIIYFQPVMRAQAERLGVKL